MLVHEDYMILGELGVEKFARRDWHEWITSKSELDKKVETNQEKIAKGNEDLSTKTMPDVGCILKLNVMKGIRIRLKVIRAPEYSSGRVLKMMSLSGIDSCVNLAVGNVYTSFRDLGIRITKESGFSIDSGDRWSVWDVVDYEDPGEEVNLVSLSDLI